MKKIITVLAITLVFSMLAGCSMSNTGNESRKSAEEKETTVAEETTVTEETTTATAEETTEPVVTEMGSEEDSRLLKFMTDYGNAINSDKYMIELSISDGTSSMTVTAFKDGDKVAVNTSGRVNDVDSDLTVIDINGETYTINHITRSMIKSTGGAPKLKENPAGSYEDYTHTVARVTLDGKEYICETYQDDGKEEKCYFTEGINNSFFIISGKNRTDIKYSTEVPEGVFDVPADYEVVVM